MGVVTAQILILIISAALALVGWVLIRRTMNRFAKRTVAVGSVVQESQAMFAILARSQKKLVPAEFGRAPAPSRAPPGAPPPFLLQPNRPMLAE